MAGEFTEEEKGDEVEAVNKPVKGFSPLVITSKVPIKHQTCGLPKSQR